MPGGARSRMRLRWLAGAFALAVSVQLSLASGASATSFPATPKPKVKTRKRKATVRFDLSADEVDVDFQCSLDDAPFAACDTTERFELRRGRHTLKAFATDAVGHEDETPAEVAVKVVRKRR
jgi:hypothetical protein